MCKIPVLLILKLQKFKWYFGDQVEFNYQLFLASNKIVVSKKNEEKFRFKVKILIYNMQKGKF